MDVGAPAAGGARRDRDVHPRGSCCWSPPPRSPWACWWRSRCAAPRGTARPPKLACAARYGDPRGRRRRAPAAPARARREPRVLRERVGDPGGAACGPGRDAVGQAISQDLDDQLLESRAPDLDPARAPRPASAAAPHARVGPAQQPAGAAGARARRARADPCSSPATSRPAGVPLEAALTREVVRCGQAVRVRVRQSRLRHAVARACAARRDRADRARAAAAGRKSRTRRRAGRRSARGGLQRPVRASPRGRLPRARDPDLTGRSNSPSGGGCDPWSGAWTW